VSWRIPETAFGIPSFEDGCQVPGQNIGCIYIIIYYERRTANGNGESVQVGNSQAVRLPKAFRVQSKEMEISRRGDEIVLRERAGRWRGRLICWRRYRRT